MPKTHVGNFTGTYYLDPSTLIIKGIYAGAVPASGTLSIGLSLNSNPAVTGLNIYMQVARVGSGKFLENLLTLALVP